MTGVLKHMLSLGRRRPQTASAGCRAPHVARRCCGLGNALHVCFGLEGAALVCSSLTQAGGVPMRRLGSVKCGCNQNVLRVIFPGPCATFARGKRGALRPSSLPLYPGLCVWPYPSWQDRGREAKAQESAEQAGHTHLHGHVAWGTTPCLNSSASVARHVVCTR